MSKFKVGDKVKRIGALAQFIDVGGSSGVFTVYGVYPDMLTLEEIECQSFNSSFFELVQDKWSIYNNDKPLSELSDEQAGKLVKHNGAIESYDGEHWYEVEPDWTHKSIYRARQKTERELFIDEWSSKIATNEYNGGNIRSLVGQMFDDVNGK